VAKHLLVDLENVQPTAEAVATWMGPVGKAWIFFGPHQHKLLAAFKALGERVTLVPISRPGANSLDFHLVFYLGYLAAGNPKSEFTLLAKDTGYDPAIDHARMLTFTVKRICALTVPRAKPASSFVGTAAGAPKQVKAQKKVAASKKSSAKEVSVAKKAAPSKKATISKGASIANKVLGNALSAKTAARPTRESAAANADDKTLLHVAATAPPAKSVPAKKQTLKPVIAIYRDVLADLRGLNRPRNLASLERSIQSRIGTEPAPEKVQTIIDRLKTSDAIRVVGNRLDYFPGESTTDMAKLVG
jgi:PIN domain-containing protein